LEILDEIPTFLLKNIWKASKHNREGPSETPTLCLAHCSLLISTEQVSGPFADGQRYSQIKLQLPNLALLTVRQAKHQDSGLLLMARVNDKRYF
jgi:hypothetical protein